VGCLSIDEARTRPSLLFRRRDLRAVRRDCLLTSREPHVGRDRMIIGVAMGSTEDLKVVPERIGADGDGEVPVLGFHFDRHPRVCQPVRVVPDRTAVQLTEQRPRAVAL